MLSHVMTRKEQLVLVFLGGSICLGAIVLYLVSDSSEAAGPDLPAPSARTPVEPSVVVEPLGGILKQDRPVVERIQVSVAGAVREAGLYSFDAESRVQEAIDAALGAEEWADLSDINLAAHLIDGTTLTIPGEPEKSRGGQTLIRRPVVPRLNPPQYTVSGWESNIVDQKSGPLAVKSGGSSGLIDINRASASELETLPGIGPKYASEIIRFREQQPFVTVDDLDMVSGIGPKRLESIRGLVTVGR